MVGWFGDWTIHCFTHRLSEYSRLRANSPSTSTSTTSTINKPYQNLLCYSSRRSCKVYLRVKLLCDDKTTSLHGQLEASSQSRCIRKYAHNIALISLRTFAKCRMTLAFPSHPRHSKFPGLASSLVASQPRLHASPSPTPTVVCSAVSRR